jgi:hypothetical protein
MPCLLYITHPSLASQYDIEHSKTTDKIIYKFLAVLDELKY